MRAETAFASFANIPSASFDDAPRLGARAKNLFADLTSEAKIAALAKTSACSGDILSISLNLGAIRLAMAAND